MNAPVDLTDVRIETPRLILRPWREGDLADFYEYASVDGVGQMAGWQPHKSMEDSRLILNSFIAHKRTFALELKENGNHRLAWAGNERGGSRYSVRTCGAGNRLCPQ